MLLALTGGLAIGLLMGALGGGGAILAIPLLVYGLGVEPATATLASLVIVGLGASTGVATRTSTISWRHGIAFGALGVAGAYAGRTLSAGVDGTALLASFGLLLLVAATLMAAKARSPKSQGFSESRPRITGLGGATRLVGAASAVGFLTGFFGVGGGFAIVPALTLILGLDMVAAVATSLLVILINSLVALALSFSHLPSLDWALLAPLLGATMFGVLCGGWVGHRVSRRALQLSFAVFLYLIALYILAGSIAQLVAVAPGTTF